MAVEQGNPVGFLENDKIERCGGWVIIPMHIAREILAIMRQSPSGNGYFIDLLRDAVHGGEKEKTEKGA